MTERGLIEDLRRLHNDSYCWALQCCAGRREDAEDILQSVYLKVLEGRAKFDAKSTFKTWLFSVIRFTTIDELRKKKSREKAFANIKFEEVSITIDESFVNKNENEDKYVDFKEMLNILPDRQKEILLLVFYHEHSIAEASEIMGISVGTGRTHYERGKERLRKLL